MRMILCRRPCRSASRSIARITSISELSEASPKRTSSFVSLSIGGRISHFSAGIPSRRRRLATRESPSIEMPPCTRMSAITGSPRNTLVTPVMRMPCCAQSRERVWTLRRRCARLILRRGYIETSSALFGGRDCPPGETGRAVQAFQKWNQFQKSVFSLSPMLAALKTGFTPSRCWAV